MQKFTLQVVPDRSELAMEVLETLTRTQGELFEGERSAGKLKGYALNEVLETVRFWMRSLGHPPSALRPRTPTRLELDEETGVKLSLLFAAVTPLKNTERIDKICHGIQRMPREEALYWYGKASNGIREQALKALRILLAGE